MSATRLATVFDGYDPQGRPVTGPHRPPLVDAEERRRIVAFLDGGIVLLAGGPLVPDQLDPGHPPVVPVGYATDGLWIWGAPLRYYVARHGVSPEPELLEHIRACDYRTPVPTPEQVERANADLQDFFRRSAEA